jgi:hypothetical protein
VDGWSVHKFCKHILSRDSPECFSIYLLGSRGREAAKKWHDDTQANDGDPLTEHLITRTSRKARIIHLINQTSGDVADDSGDAQCDVPPKLLGVLRRRALVE